MYLYQTHENKNKINWFALLATFFVALSGSYLAQTYISKIWGTEEKNETERLSNIQNNSNNKEIVLKNDNENIIENAMKSVVGISKLQANEESLFDVNLSQKWGIRHRNYCF